MRVIELNSVPEIEKGAGFYPYLFVIFHDETRPSKVLLE